MKGDGRHIETAARCLYRIATETKRDAQEGQPARAGVGSTAMTNKKKRARDPVLAAKASAAALVLLVDASLILFGGAVASGLLQVG